MFTQIPKQPDFWTTLAGEANEKSHGVYRGFQSGRDGGRTHYLPIANRMLSQMSYTPKLHS